MNFCTQFHVSPSNSFSLVQEAGFLLDKLLKQLISSQLTNQLTNKSIQPWVGGYREDITDGKMKD